jgi:predicted ArsR family transcriptional regulator
VTRRQPDLLDYPARPGYRDRGTSIAAARRVARDAATLREKVLAEIRSSSTTSGLTADEVAARLALSPFSIRPRVTELMHRGLIVDSGLRRKNASGRSAIVWTAHRPPRRSSLTQGNQP